MAEPTAGRQTSSPPDVYRLHLNTASLEPGRPHDFCLERGVIGIGWPVNGVADDTSFHEYMHRAEEHGYSRTDLSTIRRFHQIETGSLVWTRDSRRGEYFLWKVTGEWEYVSDDAAVRADVLNIHRASPVKVGYEAEVPGKVISQFIPRMTLQRVSDPTAAWYSAFLYAGRAGEPGPDWRPNMEEILDSLVSDRDLEDLVAVYLQLQGDYMVLPGSRSNSTPAYEFVLIHRGDGHEAVVQVKRGNSEINLEMLAPEPPNRAFAFSGTHVDVGDIPKGVEIISRGSLLKMLQGNPQYLPPVCRNWAKLACREDSHHA